jgi:hypothetical protein
MWACGGTFAYVHVGMILGMVVRVLGARLDGYGGKKQSYIACQGPLQETIHDFWRMVWEKNSHTLVMNTNLIEGEKQVVKCERYWPSTTDTPMVVTSTDGFGSFEVTIIREERPQAQCVAPLHFTPRRTTSLHTASHHFTSHRVAPLHTHAISPRANTPLRHAMSRQESRILPRHTTLRHIKSHSVTSAIYLYWLAALLVATEPRYDGWWWWWWWWWLRRRRWRRYVQTLLEVSYNGETRHITHLWWRDWPDKGVPKTPNGIGHYIKAARAARADSGGPIVIHCSAGVGRFTLIYLLVHMPFFVLVLALALVLARARARARARDGRPLILRNKHHSPPHPTFNAKHRTRCTEHDAP